MKHICTSMHLGDIYQIKSLTLLLFVDRTQVLPLPFTLLLLYLCSLTRKVQEQLAGGDVGCNLSLSHQGHGFLSGNRSGLKAASASISLVAGLHWCWVTLREAWYWITRQNLILTSLSFLQVNDVSLHAELPGVGGRVMQVIP